MSSSNGPSPSTRTTFTIASRASALAQIQTNFVRDALIAEHPGVTFETSFMTTEGDKNQSQALYLLGGKALWTKELEVALKEGVVDMLVHCLKDMPTVLPDGCEIGAILERENPVDSLVVKAGERWRSLEELPDGSVVGTSSVRRVAQLRRTFPKLTFLDIRGNLNTRLAKLDAPDSPYAAIILAKAGLVRLGLGHRVTADVGAPVLRHAVSQGALAVEIRSDDARARELLATLVHRPTDWSCAAERACLRVLEGGCSVPVGVTSALEPAPAGGDERLVLTGSVTGIDGQVHVEHTVVEDVRTREDAEAVGAQLARILIDTGAGVILDAITKDRERRAGETKTAEEVQKIEASMGAGLAQA